MITDKNTPLWQITLGDLLAVLDIKIEEKLQSEFVVDSREKEYVYGLKGLAELLGCSKNHASKLKKTGRFDDAIIQDGRRIIIDKEKLLEILKNREL